MNVHVYAKPPFYLVFVLFWFCSETCQNEALRQQLQGGSAAVFPFGFGIVFAPRGTKEARWASPFPSALPGGGCGPQSPPALAVGSLVPPEALAPGLEGRRPQPAFTHRFDRWAWERGGRPKIIHEMATFPRGTILTEAQYGKPTEEPSCLVLAWFLLCTSILDEISLISCHITFR